MRQTIYRSAYLTAIQSVTCSGNHPSSDEYTFAQTFRASREKFPFALRHGGQRRISAKVYRKMVPWSKRGERSCSNAPYAEALVLFRVLFGDPQQVTVSPAVIEFRIQEIGEGRSIF
jgi:hypothetical protein